MKRKIISLFVMVILLISSLTSLTFATTNIKVVIDGEQVVFDVQPQIISGRTMVPLRAIFESLDATVDWDNATRTVMSTKNGTNISLTIDSNIMYVNGSPKTLDVPATIINDRTLVPVRAISEAFSLQVGWDKNQKLVSIIDNTSSYIMVYAPGNRSMACPVAEINQYLKAGWYRDQALTDNNIPATYHDFVDFVKTKGSFNDGKYGIQTAIPKYNGSNGTSYGVITLVYDPQTDELELQIQEIYESDRSSEPVTYLFLSVELPQKADSYKWQFQETIDYPSYSRYDDYFMAAEGTLKANAKSYLNNDSIQTTNVFIGREITKGSAATNVGMLIFYVPVYGNNIFTNNGSSLSFEYFGIK